MSQHHEFGPSQLESHDPKSGGCYAFISAPGDSQKAISGSRKHEASVDGNYEILGGDERGIAEVAAARAFLARIEQTISGKKGSVYRELTLKTEQTYGTLDYLNVLGKRATIVDLKFGEWSVMPARKNLQGWAYTILVFRNFPLVNKVRVIFYAAKNGTHTEAEFRRARLGSMETRVYSIMERSARAKEAPQAEDYSPDPVNCSFCVRLNCPARLALCGTLVSQWTGKPVQLPHLDLVRLPLEQLAVLKSLSNVFKKFAEAIDLEAKRRVIDEGVDLPGYEISEKSGTRTIIGSPNISLTSSILTEVWNQAELAPVEWGDYLTDSVELSVGNLEKEIAKHAPRGASEAMKKKILDALNSAGLVHSNKVYYLSAIKR